MFLINISKLSDQNFNVLGKLNEFRFKKDGFRSGSMGTGLMYSDPYPKIQRTDYNRLFKIYTEKINPDMDWQYKYWNNT